MARMSTKGKNIIGLGVVPEETRHGFLIDIPPGAANADPILIREYREYRLTEENHPSASEATLTDPMLRVIIDRQRWLALAPAFWEEANHRLRANGLPTVKFKKSSSKAIPVHPSLGKELCILCGSVEEASPDDIPNAIKNWQALAPEERWWLYTMTVATTGQATQKGLGWRKALRAAIADNPFIKGEGMSPKSRRELLGHSQLNLNI
jgi:hypothetical protein